MGKIWAKDYELNTLIEEFTVGNDYILDQKLTLSDCASSLAHATMLQSIGILTKDELSSLQSGLGEIVSLKEKNEWVITRADEDGHTAIENYLVKHCGDAGKKIHTGRSRNDQVITAVRLYLRSFLLDITTAGTALIEKLLTFAETHESTPMPGRTHTQIAMPSSVGLWAASFAEQLSDDLKMIDTLFEIVNRCPLGSAASYGVPLPLNREMTATLLGFAEVQNNVLYVNNSRGKLESMALDAFDQIGLTFSKIAQDLILFSLPEFGYFSLPVELCSGSSIMPQKKNPDGLELMRSKASILSSLSGQVKNIIRSQTSGYNRDFQDTKEPLLKGCDLVLLMTQVIDLTFSKLKVNKENLLAAFTPEIYATDVALELVAKGASFRDAYKEVGLNLDKLSNANPADYLNNRTYTGTTGNLNLSWGINANKALIQRATERKTTIDKSLTSLMGREINLS